MDSSGDLSGIDVPKAVGTPLKEEPIMTNTTLSAVDVAKSVFEIVVSQRPGKVTERQRRSRFALVPFGGARPPASVGMEAYGSAHYWSRQMQSLGHQVVLLPPPRECSKPTARRRSGRCR
jgi:transposase